MHGRRRCRLHGGLSTGPKTLEGLARIRATKTTHGRFSAATRAFKRWRRRYIVNGYRSARAMPDAIAREHFLMRASEDIPPRLIAEMRRLAGEEVARKDVERLSAKDLLKAE